MEFFKLKILFIGLLFSLSLIGKCSEKKGAYPTPEITVIFIIDQFAYHYLNKIKPYLKYGLKRLLTNGLVYHEATHPHAMPSTPTGHAAISTGALPYVHGIVGYGYVDEENNYVTVVDTHVKDSADLCPTGNHDFGHGPQNLCADTICDQFALSSRPGNPCKSFAISYKPRASVLLSGSAGKAFWFDEKFGGMTSCGVYYPELPKWLVKVNEEFAPTNNKKYTWKSFYPKNSKAYRSAIDDYKHSLFGKCLIGSKVVINCQDEEPWKQFSGLPQVDNLLLKTAQALIAEHCNVIMHKRCRLLLFVSLSGFDFSAHAQGPDSIEQLDKIYHLDKGIGKFMNFAQQMGGTKRTLFGLTADHGSMQIPELLHTRGLMVAERIDAEGICNKLDQLAQKRYKLGKIIKKFEAPQFFFDKDEFKKLTPEQQESFLDEAKALIINTPGIKNCWTADELLEMQESGCTNDYYKNLFATQAFKGRTGDLVCLTHPYKQLSKYPTGTSHCSPYKYDVHVPLAFYQSKVFDKGKNIYRPVCTTAIAPTLAHLLGCSSPSGALTPILTEMEHN